MPDPSDTRRKPGTDRPASTEPLADEITAAPDPAEDGLASLAPPRAPGELGWLSHYRVKKRLGRGGMGAVFLAEDAKLQRPVALKVMLPKFAANPKARERFVREARLAAKIRHDNVVTIYQVDEERGVPFIAMELLSGMPLDVYLQKKGTPPVAQALRVAREVAEGLAAAHGKGLIHRDIKPSNVWLEAPKGRVKILDFGLARPVDDTTQLTHDGAVIGTPAFMSPEQARGDRVDPRTDLFSLGGVLYMLCTGRLPFKGDTPLAMLLALAQNRPEPVQTLNPEVPPALAQLIDRLLAKSPNGRPGSAAEVVKEIRGIERTVGPAALPLVGVTGQQFAAEPPRRGRGRAILATIAVLGLAAGGVVGYQRLMDARPDNAGQPEAKGDPQKETLASETQVQAADWALKAGGLLKIRQDGKVSPLNAGDPIPTGDFQVVELELPETAVATADDRAHLERFSQLETLVIRSNGLTDDAVLALPVFPELTSLTLHSTRLTDKVVEYVKRLPRVQTLDLEHVPLTDTGLAGLAGVATLKEVRVSRATMSLRGLTAFHGLRKDCELLVDGTLYIGPKKTPLDSKDPPPPKKLAPVRVLQGHTDQIRGLAFLDDHHALSASWDKTIRLWDVTGDSSPKEWARHDAFVNHLELARGGRRVLTTGSMHEVKVWDAQGKELTTIRTEQPVATAALSPDGLSVLIAEGKGPVTLWGLGPKQRKRKTFQATGVIGLTFLPDGKSFLAGTLGPNPTILLFETDKPDPVRRFEGHAFEVHALAVLPDGKRFVSASADGTLRVWSLADAKDSRRFQDAKGDRDARYTSLALCPDGRRAVTGSFDGVIRLWDLETGTVLARFPAAAGSANQVAVSPDGRYVLTGGGGRIEFGKGWQPSGDYQLRLWRLPPP